MPGERKTLPAADLHTLIAALFEKRGLSTQDAATIAGVMVWADLRGVDSHGVSRVPRYLEMLVSGEANPNANITVEDTRPATVVVHADGAPGPVAMTRAMNLAIDKAQTSGVAWAGVRGTVHTGAIGHYAELAAKAGMIGIGIVAGMPNMGYTGAKSAAVATSPLAIAVPSARHGNVILDMATATIALGRIQQYLIKGQPLPEGAAVTKEGEPTIDPAVAAIPTPMSGPKGSGLSLMFELLTSVLLANPIVAPFHAKAPGGRKHKQNAALIAVDIAAFGPKDAFMAAVDDALDAIKNLPRSAEDQAILFPGERGAETARSRSSAGISLPPKLWANLQKAAEELGVAVP